MGFCCNGFGWGGWVPWGGMGIIGLIVNLLFFLGLLAALGVGAAWFVRQFSPQAAHQRAEADPLEIARRRLASGEITIAEFEEIHGRLQR